MSRLTTSTQMDERLRADLVSRLLRDYAFKERGEKLHGGTCPACGKKELWAYASSPWKLTCNRINNCGYSASVRELYPDAFASWSDRFTSTPANPHAAADAYLSQARHFDIEPLKGCYTQGTFYDPASGQGSATVRFTLAEGVTWERIIDRPERFGRQKGRASGSYKGLWWCPPDLDVYSLPSGADLWITEGIFDAIALWQNGIPAVAAISCVSYPATALARLAESCAAAAKTMPRLVFALDADPAGIEWMQKHAARAIKQGFSATAAYIPSTRAGKKADWNDAHIAGNLARNEDSTPSRHIADYLHAGAVLLASTALDKALLICAHTGRTSFSVAHNSRLHWFKLDLDKYNKELQALNEADKEGKFTEQELRHRAAQNSGNMAEICNVLPEILYFQSNAATDESWYYLKISYPPTAGTATVKAAFTGAQLAASAEFKKRLLSVAQSAVWAGSTAQLDTLVKEHAEGLRHVQTIDFVGYSKPHAAYIFADVAVKNGKVYELNNEDFFEINERNANGRTERLSIKTTSHSTPLALRPYDALNTDWVQPFLTAYGTRGIVALGFWLGSLFACQLRASIGSYPFIEIVGKAGSGKSALIEFLWKLLGRAEYEGFDPKKSSFAGRTRSMAQVSNLPVVFIEADRNDSNERPFDWEELKTAYNGRISSVRGVKNNGNDTKESEFNGALVISQNSHVSSHEAIMERIVGLEFDKSQHTPEGKAASDTLGRIPAETLGNFMLHALKNEAAILATVAELFPRFDAELLQHGYTTNIRIAKNHAQLMALVWALQDVLKGAISTHALETALQYLRDAAPVRDAACRAEGSVMQEFWDAYHYLQSQTIPDGAGGHIGLLNHSSDASLIAINLPHMLQVCAERRVSIPDSVTLKRALKDSRTYKFLDTRVVKSQINAAFNRAATSPHSPTRSSTAACWVFSSEPTKPIKPKN